jgi:hypothetical protein
MLKTLGEFALKPYFNIPLCDTMRIFFTGDLQEAHTGFAIAIFTKNDTHASASPVGGISIWRQ